MVKRRRRQSDRKKFNLKKFLRDYPIVPILAIVFILGVWAGFALGRQSVGWKERMSVEQMAEFLKKKAEKISIPQVAIPKAPFKRLAQKVREVTRISVPKKEGPQLVIVIDDIGYNKRNADLLFSIHEPIALAILPQLPYSKYFAEEGKRRGFETILHLPLEPNDPNDNPGVGVITIEMDSEEVKATLEKNLASVPHVVGVNNHMGSRATRDRSLMYLITKELRSKGLFFLDSMTHPKSVAYEMARLARIPTVKRDVFIDNQDNFDAVSEKIDEAATIAKKTGQAIAIGHIRENTLRAIKEAIPRLKAEGIQLATLKEIL